MTLAGRISSSGGLKGSLSVEVWIEDNRFKQTTNADSHGWFYFLNLAKGDYALTIGNKDQREAEALSVQLWQFKENGGKREAEVLLDERQENKKLQRDSSKIWKVCIR